MHCIHKKMIALIFSIQIYPLKDGYISHPDRFPDIDNNFDGLNRKDFFEWGAKPLI